MATWLAARRNVGARIRPAQLQAKRPGGLLTLAVAQGGTTGASANGDIARPAGVPSLPGWGAPASRASRWLGSAVRARAAGRYVDIALVGALVAVVAVVHGINMGHSPAFFDDEGTYVSQAWAVTHLGELAPYTYWYDHPPLGWLAIAVWSELTRPFVGGGVSIADARELMLVLALVDAVLLFVIARRLEMRRGFAALAVGLCLLSPLAVHYQRMVLLDNLGVTWLLATFMLALSPTRRLGAYAGAGVCLAAAVLSKETLVLVLPAVLLLVWQRSDGPNRGFSVGMFMAAFTLVSSFYPLFATLRGELLPGAHHTSLFAGIQFQLTRPGGGGLTNSHSGTRQLLSTWLHADPLLLSAGVLLAPIGLALGRLRAISLALMVPVVMAVRPNAYVPAMFVIGLLPFAALIAAGLADELYRHGTVPMAGRLPARFRVAGARSVLIGVGAGLVLIAGPAWSHGDVSQMRRNDAAPAVQAVDWLDQHVDHRSTIVVDDTIWEDLVDRGFAPQRTIWFYKLDLDPAVRVPFQHVDYIVSTNIMQGNARDLPRTADLLAHSRPVATFVSDTERFQIRRIIPSQTVSPPKVREP